MGANYTDLLDNIDSMQDHKFSLIPDDLKAAKEVGMIFIKMQNSFQKILLLNRSRTEI